MTTSTGQISLRPYQQNAAELLARSLTNNNVAVDLSDTGLGKTFHSLGAVSHFDVKFVVICRAVSRHKWKKAVVDFGLDDRCLAIDSYQKFTSGRHYRDLVVKQLMGRGASYSWRPTESTIVIFDEVQDAGGQNSLNSQLLIGASRCPNVYPLCLSATVADSPLKLKALGFCTGMHTLTNYFAWAMDHGCGKSPFGYNQLYFKTGQRKEVIGRLHSHLIPKYGLRVKREEVQEFMPEETIEIELWDVGKRPHSGPIFEALERLEEIREEDLDRHEDGTPSSVETMRDRQEAELRKIPALVNEVTGAVESGLYVAIFLNFTASIDALKKWLDAEGIHAGIFDGRDIRQRELDHAYFQSGQLKVLILQSQAGSAAIDLHDTEGGRPRCTFISPTYHAETMLQMLGRATRFGAKSPVLQRICFAEGTIEERVYRVAALKCENIRALNDGLWASGFGG
jgi:superfamily II DNA or RNA helicase